MLGITVGFGEVGGAEDVAVGAVVWRDKVSWGVVRLEVVTWVHSDSCVNSFF